MHSIEAVKIKKCIGALAALLLSLMLAVPALAQVKPGDVITPDNAYKVKRPCLPGGLLQSRARHVDENRALRSSRLAAALQGRNREIFFASPAVAGWAHG